MPIYEYECQSCGRRTEMLQRMADPPLTVCENCGGELKKLISSPAFQFKGSGWYVTDYAGKKGAPSSDSKESKSSGSSEGGSSSSSSESSAAKPAESKPSGSGGSGGSGSSD